MILDQTSNLMREAEIRVSSGNATGRLMEGAVLDRLSSEKRTSFVAEERKNDPTHIPLHDLIGGLDIDGNPPKDEPIFISDESDNEMQDVTYSLPSIEKDGFVISDLVWGKEKSHPWWPGLLIDPSDASNLAMKYQKKDAHLVAYFGDKTFAWCEESQLKPFFKNFSRFKNQSSFERLNKAVEVVLAEVSRRFELGTICSCLDEKLLLKKEYPKIDNSGVKERFSNYPVDRGEIVNYFNPKGLIGFIKALALVPYEGSFDKLGLVMAFSQINSLNVFYKTKCYSTPARDEIVKDIRKRGRLPKKKIEESDIHLNGSKPNNKPEKATTNENESASRTPKKQKFIVENEANISCAEPVKRPVIIPVKGKRSDEWNPTGLQLTFGTRFGPVPSEMDLVRIFSRYGALKGEMEKDIEGSESKIKIVFKKHADAEMAFWSLIKENVFGPELLSYRLVYLNEMEKKSKVPNGDDRRELKKVVLGSTDANIESCSEQDDHNVEEISIDSSSHVQGEIVVNPNPNPNLESTIYSGDTLVNPNPNSKHSLDPNPSSTICTGETLVNANPNPNPSRNPNHNQPSTIQTSYTLVDYNHDLDLIPTSDPDTRPKGSMTISCNTVLPLEKTTSALWQTIEKLEVFSRTPQKPHFMKLQKYSQELREGQAIGLMLTYAHLVNSLPHLSFDDDVSVFEGKISCLDELEGNGFDVNPIRTRLNKLVQVKTDNDVSNRVELEKELVEREKENESLEASVAKVNWELVDVSESIKELKERCDKFIAERDELLELNTVENGVHISRLKEEICSIKKLDESACEKFKRLLVEPW